MNESINIFSATKHSTKRWVKKVLEVEKKLYITIDQHLLSSESQNNTYRENSRIAYICCAIWFISFRRYESGVKITVWFRY